MEFGSISEQPSGMYKLMKEEGEFWHLLHRYKDDVVQEGGEGHGWEIMHRFRMQPFELADFQETADIFAQGKDPNTTTLSTTPIAVVKVNEGMNAIL